MPGRSRDTGRGRDVDAPTIRQAHSEIAHSATAGRPGSTAPTRSSGRPGDAPDGPPTRIDRNQNDDARRSLSRENESAVILASAGYRVRQNPSADQVAEARRRSGDVGTPTSEPDYLIEGRVFDCYAPGEGTTVRNVWAQARKKILREQTQRVLLNLVDWKGDLAALRKQFDDWPLEELKEIKAITPDSGIIQIVPRPPSIERPPHGA